MPRVALHGETKPRPNIGVYSFGLKTVGNKIGKQFSQFEFDVTQFRDPAGQAQFRGKNGLDSTVKNWVKDDDRVAGVVANCLMIADDLIKPKAKTEETMYGSKTETSSASVWLSFAFMDYHGRWVAPAMAEIVADALSDAGYMVGVFHRDLKQPEEDK